MLFSNEIVFRGHPDKVCDQISDALIHSCEEAVAKIMAIVNRVE